MESLSLGITKKEIAARAVLRDVWQSGHHCVELRQDGCAFIFFCTLCSVRCYSDTTLAHHLQGNRHARRLESATGSAIQPFAMEDGDQRTFSCKGTPKIDANALASLKLVEPFPSSSIEWIGSGNVLYEEGLQEHQIQQVCCEWYGRDELPDIHDYCTAKQPERLAYALVVFPYSDSIGRQGEWKPKCSAQVGENSHKEKLCYSDSGRRAVKNCCPPKLSLKDSEGKFVQSWKPPTGEEEGTCSFLLKEFSQRDLLKALKRRRLNLLERVCFICHQQMLPGRDVAGLLNLNTWQMMCSSRNERGAFHVFHASCLIDWILLCEIKFCSARMAKNDVSRMRGQMNKKPRKGKARVKLQSSGPLFCPECQGTGIEVHGHKLEQPRYRLVQVFDWIMELIQARRSWVDHTDSRRRNCRGLLFSSEAQHKIKAVSLGTLDFYAADSLEFLVSASSTRLLPLVPETSWRLKPLAH